jgi:PAS domain S-box-containing protein
MPTDDGHRALANHEFHAHFQPLVVLRTGRLDGFELLARWTHPERGAIEPRKFIPVAEKEGWIDALTWELMRQGFDAAAAWPRALRLAINISPLQLRNTALASTIKSLADASGFALDRLTIEITESALSDDVARPRAIALDLKALGCKLALDDFGTGYSSLSQLQLLPFDELKVDRSFVSSMTGMRESRKIVAAVVGLGQSLNLTTVAEGVETRDQEEMLVWLGCELAQGWLYGKAVPAAELPALIAAPVLAVRTPSPDADGKEPTSRRSLDSLPAQRLAQLQAVYDGAPVGLAFLDCHLKYTNLNRRLADMNGHPIEAHLGRTVPEMIPELFPLIEPYIRRALDGESIAGVELTKPASGAYPSSTILLSYEPARDEGGEVVGISVALIDVTTLRRAEQARRETEQHLRYLMDLMPQIPWIIDADGRALEVGQRWLEITGMTGDTWKGFGWLAALHPDDRQPTIDAVQQCFVTGLPIDVEYRVRRPGSDWQRMRSRGSARLGPDDVVVGWYGYLEAVNEGT